MNETTGCRVRICNAANHESWRAFWHFANAQEKRRGEPTEKSHPRRNEPRGSQVGLQRTSKNAGLCLQVRRGRNSPSFTSEPTPHCRLSDSQSSPNRYPRPEGRHEHQAPSPYLHRHLRRSFERSRWRCCPHAGSEAVGCVAALAHHPWSEHAPGCAGSYADGSFFFALVRGAACRGDGDDRDRGRAQHGRDHAS